MFILFFYINILLNTFSTKEGTGGVHGSPLGAVDLAQVKQKFGFDPEKVPKTVMSYRFIA